MWKYITVIGIMLSLFFGTMNSAVNTFNNLVAVAEEHSAYLQEISMTEEPTMFTVAKAVAAAEQAKL